jgi:hypothetical protein
MKDKIIICIGLIIFIALCFIILKLHANEDDFKPLKTERKL